jgi:hypothetical protein
LAASDLLTSRFRSNPCARTLSAHASSSSNAFGVLQVGGVEALGEPAVDRREELAAKVGEKFWNG